MLNPSRTQEINRKNITLCFPLVSPFIMKMAIWEGIVSPRRKDFGSAGGCVGGGPAVKSRGMGWTGDKIWRHLDYVALS